MDAEPPKPAVEKDGATVNIFGSKFTIPPAKPRPQVNRSEKKKVTFALPEISKDDVVIAVMGVTGAGKSTFISYFCDEVKVGHELKSCTVEVKPHLSNSLTQLAQRRVWLVDTPGFDDSTLTDIEVLRDIATFLTSTYKHEILLTGIIYLHRISDNRMGGSGFRQMQMFRKLCGAENMGNVALVTTMWSTVQADDGVQREQELKTKDGFWKRLIEQGARTFRQDQGADSAQKIVQHLIAKKRRPVLDIQKEMVDGNKLLDDTAAGKEMTAELAKQRERYKADFRSLKSEMQEARRADKDAWTKELRKLEKKLQEAREATERLHLSCDDLFREMEARRRTNQAEQQRQDEPRVRNSTWLFPTWTRDSPTSVSRRSRSKPRSSYRTRSRGFRRACCTCGAYETFTIMNLDKWTILNRCNECGHWCKECSEIKLSRSESDAWCCGTCCRDCCDGEAC